MLDIGKNPSEVNFERISRRYNRSEIIVDGVVNAFGVMLALVGTTLLVGYVSNSSSLRQILAVCVYCCALLTMLTASFLYNIWPISRTKQLLRRCDHSAIFIMIAGSYTPFLEFGLHKSLLLCSLFAIWVFALTGATLKSLFPGRLDKLTILMYLALGWSGLIFIGPMAESIPANSMTLIVVGGVVYSTGVIFHAWNSLRFQNAIWHSFVIAGATIHYFAVFGCYRQ